MTRALYIGGLLLPTLGLLAGMDEPILDAIDRALPAVVSVRGALGDHVSQGSGFLIDPKGYLVTNYHVVEKGGNWTVTFKNRQRARAEVIGFNKRYDLALLKISLAVPAPFLTFADPDQIRVGETVLALGSPRDLDHTVTKGIVSAKERMFEWTDQKGNILKRIPGMIQTDAPINKGNSGGPLVNLRGEIVGINSLKDLTADGVGFAVSSREIKKRLAEMQQGVKKEDPMPYLGVAINRITTEGRLSDGETGVEVWYIQQDGPAYGKLEGGMILMKIGGYPIQDDYSFAEAIARHEVGQTVTFTVKDRGETKDIPIVLAPFPAPVRPTTPATPSSQP